MEKENARAGYPLLLAGQIDMGRLGNMARKAARKFIRRYGIALAVAAVFIAYGWAVSAVTTVRVEKRVAARVEAEVRAEIAQEQEAERAALTSPDAIKQAALDEEADALARLLYGYRDNSKRDRQTLIWCVLARADNASYPATVGDVVSQPNQWMFYSRKNPVRDEDREMALEQLEYWHDGKYPAGFGNDFVFAEWHEHDIVLRNTWVKNSNTSYWRMPE